MSDRSEAEDVRRRFGAALDERDWAALAALFTDRVLVDLPALGAAGSDLPRQEVVDLFRHSFRRPAADNPTQQLHGNVARRSTGTRRLHLPPARPPPARRQGGLRPRAL